MALVLASGSATRQRLLADAGVDFAVRPADIDERAAEAPLIAAGGPQQDVALLLATAKALNVSDSSPRDLVIGADQTLEVDGERLTKPADMEAARRQLLYLSGKRHRLHSALACARDGEVIWDYVDTASLTMRPLSPAFVGRYLAAAGPAALTSVGSYRLEGRGIQLFQSIDGDFFTILGLPLLPLLQLLRAEGFLE